MDIETLRSTLADARRSLSRERRNYDRLYNRLVGSKDVELIVSMRIAHEDVVYYTALVRMLERKIRRMEAA